MTVAQMRRVSTTTTSSLAVHSRWKKWLRIIAPHPSPTNGLGLSGLNAGQVSRSLARVRLEPLSELWFTAATPMTGDGNGSGNRDENGVSLLQTATRCDPLVRSGRISLHSQTTVSNGAGRVPLPKSGSDHKPLDERTIKLGKTLRTLSPLLPNILTTPLPPEILAPNISLHLFPSTHPHLPVVKGKIAYRAALWTAPVAWGCVPVVGNVRLEVMSEKMVRSGHISAPVHVEEDEHCGEEKLVVRWRTEAKKNGTGASSVSASSAVDNGGVNRGLSTLLGGDRPLFGKDAETDTFTGLFVFSFDREGRVVSHTIEHADEAGGYDKTSRVVTLADWLLGKARWRNLQQDEGVAIPGLACRVRVCREELKKDFWSQR